MFDRVSLPPLRIALAIALAATTALAATPPAKADSTAAPQATAPSIQYQEALSHASDTYSFSPGGVVTVPFRPRAGDSIAVDGMAPAANPAGEGSAAAAPDLTGPSPVRPNAAATSLRREVLGFLPYWELGSTLDYTTLSTVAYFGIDLNGDGTLNKSGNGWNGWIGSTMTSVINSAHVYGTRVALTVQSFAWDGPGIAAQTALLSSPTASLTAAQQIAAEVGRRGADGVDLDFEPIAPGQSNNYVAFVKTMRAELDKVHPGYELTFCATGRPNTYDLANLLAPGAADAVFIMGYDFRGGSPGNTGSIDPLTSPWIYDLTDAVNRFIAQAPASTIILGLPWYGHAWSTNASNAVNAPPADPATYGQPAAVYYSTAAGLAAMNDSAHLGKLYDTVEQTAWTAYYGQAGDYGPQATWRELYFDDAQALGARLDAIDAWNLRGVGIWALGYDNNNGDGDLTQTIAAKLQTPVAPAPPPVSAGATYHPLAPARLLDTRSGNGLSGKLSANTPRTFAVSGRGGVPAGATAVTGNLTVTGSSAGWAIYLGPDPVASPTSSTINFKAGDTLANGLTVALSATGSLSATYISTAGKTTDLVFDVTGYFTPDAAGATYHPLAPARLLDTRSGNGLSGKLSANTPRTFAVSGRGGVPAGATAVTGNLTVTGSSAGWAIYLGPDPVASPTSSTINFKAGDTLANGLTVALSATGSLSATYISTAGKTTDLVFDVTGYFTPDAAGATYHPLAPARLLDTRAGNGLSGKLSANTPATFAVTGGGGVPAGATAVTGNLTVTGSSSGWAIYIGPDPVASPTSSTINFVTGDVKANGLTVALSATGTLSATYISTAGKTTDLVFDVTGYFTP